VVDNSEDVSALGGLLSEFKNVEYIPVLKNVGFAAGCNVGIKKFYDSDADMVLLLNNDTIVKDDFLEKLINGMALNNADVATGKIYYYSAKNVIWGAGGKMDWKRGMGVFYGNNATDNSQFDMCRLVDFISGCMMLISRTAIDKAGMLNDKFFMYCEDVDFSIRAKKAGLKLIYVPDSVIWHKVGAKKITANPFFIYYFVRNSFFIIKQYGNLWQKTCYCLYSPIYYLVKIVLSPKGYLNNFKAFFVAIWDGIISNDGRKNYDFLKG